MNPSVIASIIFLISCIFISSGFYLVRKSEKELNAVVWIAVTFMTWMCYNAYLSAFINLIRIPINIKTISIFNIIIGLFIWYRIIKRKEIQKYSISKFDVAAFAIIIGVVVLLGIRRFGLSLQENYLTSDPSIHFQFAMDIVNEQKLSGMYFAQLNNALIIETLSPFFEVIKYYKIFIMADILMFLLSGLIFYSVIRRWMKNSFLKVLGLVVTIGYLLAYPLNNLVFGFVYLGLGVSVAAYIIICVDTYINDELEKKLNILLLSFGMLALFICYALFIPVVYLATFIAMSVYFYKKKDLFTVKTFLRYVIIYAVPVALGFIYTYLGTFTDGVSPSSAISNEGGIYRDLYSNFIFVIPFALYGFIMNIKNKKIDASSWVFIILDVFVAGFLIVGLKTGKLSSYYYYKNYYLLWLMAMIMMFQGMTYLYKVKEFVAISVVMIFGLTAISTFNIEDRIANINANYVSAIRADQYCDLYAYNLFNLKTPRRVIDTDKMQLFNYDYDNLIVSGEFVPVVASAEEVYWYEAITNQRQKKLLFWERDKDNYIDTLEKTDEIKYVTVLTASEAYNENKEYFDSFNKIYENEAGFIISIK